MTTPTLFDFAEPSPINDAAPTGIGACVNGQNKHDKRTTVPLKVTPALRRNAPDTSREAARQIAGHIPNQLHRALDYIRARGRSGATDPEIAAGTGLLLQSVNPRRGALAKAGLIVLSGERRPSPSRRPCRVWIAVEFADRGGKGDVQ